MRNCIFCKIVAGEIESTRIWEDEKFLAILDVNPNTRGMTLVLPKVHYDSYAFDLPKDVYSDFMFTSQSVAKMIEKGLQISRVAMVMEGMSVNDAHIKLYPLHGIKGKFQEMWVKDQVFFERYEGYVSTQLGPQADMSELMRLAEEIKLSSTS